MTIRQITLLFVAIATPMIAMDRDHSGKKGPKPCPNNVRGSRGVQVTPFVNNGVVFNAGNFRHHGPFINTGSGIVVNSGTWNSGNIPHPQYPQYSPHHPYAQPPVYLPVAYAAHPTQQQKPTQNPQTPALNRKNALNYKDLHCELTPQQKSDVEYVQKYQTVCDLLPKNLQVSVSTIDKLNSGEKALFASGIASRLEKDEKAQDVKRVMHVFSEEDKSPRLISLNQTTSTENKSLFFAEPQSHILETNSTPLWKPFELSPDAKAMGKELEQLTLTWEQLGLPEIRK